MSTGAGTDLRRRRLRPVSQEANVRESPQDLSNRSQSALASLSKFVSRANGTLFTRACAVTQVDSDTLSQLVLVRSWIGLANALQYRLHL